MCPYVQIYNNVYLIAVILCFWAGGCDHAIVMSVYSIYVLRELSLNALLYLFVHVVACLK